MEPISRIENALINLDKKNQGSENVEWVSQNTAILVVHGIGNQLPIETLDMFGRGLIKQYLVKYPEMYITHQTIIKSAGPDENVWFDNVLRLNKEDSPYYIDLYEYYWANYTEDKANTNDIKTWLDGVARGASKFYRKNAKLGKKYHSKSFFFDKKGNLRKGFYRFFLFFLKSLLPLGQLLMKGVLRLITWIPIIGNWAVTVINDIEQGAVHNFENIIGDIVVYNVTDPKNKYYAVKRSILDGAVKALKFLIEKGFDEKDSKTKGELTYPSVVVAGHSLGSQVTYDAINKINLMINEGQIKNYCPNGRHIIKSTEISSQLSGYITFGSPLDKIAFFLREIVPDKDYIRQQMLDDYHGFKQQDWSLDNKDPHFKKLGSTLNRYLENILWHNYFDMNDPVSGSLDFYKNLININCKFKAKAGYLSFTHSNYWDCDEFYLDIIKSFLK